MSNKKCCVIGGISGLAIGILGFILFWFVLLGNLGSNFGWSEWYVILIAVGIPAVTGVAQGMEHFGLGFAEVLKYIGKEILISLVVNIAILVIVLVIGITMAFATGSAIDILIFAFILGLIGAPAAQLVIIIIGG